MFGCCEDVFEGAEGFGFVFGERRGDDFEVGEADLYLGTLVFGTRKTCRRLFLGGREVVDVEVMDGTDLREELSSSGRGRCQDDSFPTDHVECWEIQWQRRSRSRWALLGRCRGSGRGSNSAGGIVGGRCIEWYLFIHHGGGGSGGGGGGGGGDGGGGGGGGGSFTC